MALGLMNRKAQLCIEMERIDSEGFNWKTVGVVAEMRVFVEGRHGSERWANLAAFSESTELFRFRRIPHLEITTKHYIICEGIRYNILSVENVKGRNMYTEVLAKRVEASNG